jgi:enoyl-CoA hydratase/carnithine racemase
MSSAPDFETLTVAVEGRIGRLTLNQPKNLNPLGNDTLHELAEAATWLDSTDVPIVVVTGEGRAFTAGFDLRQFGDKDGAGAQLGRAMADAVESMTALTIAAIKGPCIGGGVVLASACDMRIAADDTTFVIPEVDLGIPLTWGGIPRLVRLIGPAMANELVLTCRPFDPAEAKEIGFVNRVVPRDELEATVDEMAELLATKAPSVVKATKRQVAEALDEMASTRGSWADATLMEAALADPEARAAARRYLESRSR